jgi:hypothetical protein
MSDVYREVEPSLIGNMGIEDPATPRFAESGRHVAFDQAQARLVELGAIAVVDDWVTFVNSMPPEVADFPGGPVYRPGTEHRARERQTSRSNWLEQIRQEQQKAAELEAIRRDRKMEYERYVELVREHIAAGYLTDIEEINSCLAELTKLGGLKMSAAREQLGLTNQRRQRRSSPRSKAVVDSPIVPSNADANLDAVVNPAPSSGELDRDVEQVLRALRRRPRMERGQLLRYVSIDAGRLERVIGAMGERYPGSIREEPGQRSGRTKTVLYLPETEDGHPEPTQ